MKKIIKKLIKEIAETYFYYTVCLAAYFILVQFHVHPYYPQKQIGVWTLVVAWVIASYGGDYLIKKYEEFCEKKKKQGESK